IIYSLQVSLYFYVYHESASRIFLFFFQSYDNHRDLHSFPTRRSSDLNYRRYVRTTVLAHWGTMKRAWRVMLADGTALVASAEHRDRKSTRLNSSHLGISYAVFCLKKKKKTKTSEDRMSKIETKAVWKR